MKSMTANAAASAGRSRMARAAGAVTTMSQ